MTLRAVILHGEVIRLHIPHALIHDKRRCRMAGIPLPALQALATPADWVPRVRTALVDDDLRVR